MCTKPSRCQTEPSSPLNRLRDSAWRSGHTTSAWRALPQRPRPPRPLHKPSGAPPQPYTCMEHVPPKLTQDRIDALVRKFSKKLSRRDPLIRCHAIHTPSQPRPRRLKSRLSWVPWQYRLSAKQYQEIHEAKAHKPLRSEMQILAQAMVDDTPEISLENRTLARVGFSAAKRSSATPQRGTPCQS